MSETKSVLGTTICTQIGILVRDIEAAARAYADFFGVEVPPISQTGENRAVYHGRPTPARTRQAFFDIGPNIQIELLQPDEEESVWRHDLDTYGEGVHHIAFQVNDTEKCVELCRKRGWETTQTGTWPTGRYTYIDARDSLKVVLELLESGRFE